MEGTTEGCRSKDGAGGGMVHDHELQTMPNAEKRYLDALVLGEEGTRLSRWTC